MKRLYKEVSVIEVPEGFAVLLDGRPVMTPGRWQLVLPTHALAAAIAAEWEAHGAHIRPDTMPLMQLAATVLDHVAIHRAAIEAATLRYAETDTVCYRADAPLELVRLQRITWDPLLDWLAEQHRVALAISTGILPVAQAQAALDGLSRIMAAMDDWRLCAFQAAVACSGSFVIALALTEGQIDAGDAFRAAEVDASFEIDRWGEDAESTHRRRTVAADLAAARRFVELLGG